MAHKKEEEKQCKCHTHDHECDCKNGEHDCGCGGNCECDDCGCGEHEEHECGCGCGHDHQNIDLATEYLNMARIIQADFDNYRKRSIESIKQAKIDGTVQALEVILPCLDVFTKAKQMIKDENALKGIEMVENEINNSLKTLGVEKIQAKGAQFNPNFHNALSVIEDKTKPDNEVLEEYQAGYKLNDKVIKYSQVIVNKLKEDK